MPPNLLEQRMRLQLARRSCCGELWKLPDSPLQTVQFVALCGIPRPGPTLQPASAHIFCDCDPEPFPGVRNPVGALGG